MFASQNLQGEVKVQGAKNSILKLMIAAMLTQGEQTFTNCPDITDVHDMGEIITSLGGKVKYEPHTISITSNGFHDCKLDANLIEKMRASVALLGPMLSTLKEVRLPLPGGDDFGSRPVDIHVRCLEAMGAEIKLSSKEIYAKLQKKRLIGTRLVLEYPSHTTTDNLIMAAVLAEGETVIENAAREPEVVDLANFLNSLGAKIQGAGTSRIVIDGIDKLTGSVVHEVIPDRVEAATLISAVGIAGGDVNLIDAVPFNMDMLLVRLDDMGMKFKPISNGLNVKSTKRTISRDVQTLPYPGIATDYKPAIVTLLSVSEGTSVVTENIFIGRFRYVEELLKMGANVTTEGHHVIVRGVESLIGATVESHDIRAGAALVLAGLKAEGETTITNVHHIDRGYENLPRKLQSIGANVAYVE